MNYINDDSVYSSDEHSLSGGNASLLKTYLFLNYRDPETGLKNSFLEYVQIDDIIQMNEGSGLDEIRLKLIDVINATEDLELDEEQIKALPSHIRDMYLHEEDGSLIHGIHIDAIMCGEYDDTIKELMYGDNPIHISIGHDDFNKPLQYKGEPIDFKNLRSLKFDVRPVQKQPVFGYDDFNKPIQYKGEPIDFKNIRSLRFD